MLRVWIKENDIMYFVIVEPLKDAFGKYKTKEYINTTEGRIPRKNIVKVETVEDPWQFASEQ